MDECNPVIGLCLRTPLGTVTNSQLSVSPTFCYCISELSARQIKSYISRQLPVTLHLQGLENYASKDVQQIKTKKFDCK